MKIFNNKCSTTITKSSIATSCLGYFLWSSNILQDSTVITFFFLPILQAVIFHFPATQPYVIFPVFPTLKFKHSVYRNFFHLCFWLSKANGFASAILFRGYAIIKVEERLNFCLLISECLSPWRADWISAVNLFNPRKKITLTVK